MAFGFGFGLPMIGNPQWSPASLFYQSEPGAWYDPSDLSTLYQDQAGTTPVTAVEQSVGLMKDKSGRGNHAYTPSASATSRPVLSARYNLLTKTEQFDNAVWNVRWGGAATVVSNDPTFTAPDGTITVDKVTNTIGGSGVGAAVTLTAGVQYTLSAWVNAATSSGQLQIATSSSGGGQVAAVNIPTTAGLNRYSVTYTPSVTQTYYVGTVFGAALVHYIWGADLRVSNEPSTLPVYQRVNTSTDYDTVGFPLYLKADGVDDYMQTNSIDFTATDKMTVWAGVRKLSDAATGMVTELSSNVTTNNGSFYLTAPTGAGASNFQFASKGTTANTANPTGYAAPISAVLSMATSITPPSLAVKANGVALPISTSDQGTGNFGNYPLYLFRRGGSSIPFNGRFYGMTVLGAAATTNQIVQGETYLNQKMGLVY